MEKKVWYKSKTIWVAFFTFIYGLLPFVGIEVEGATVATITSILFTVLRFLTGVEIGMSDLEKK